MIGFLAGALTTAAFAPQLIQAVRTGRTRDISLGMLVCVSTGMTLWLVHGLRIGDTALILSNGASLAMALPLLFLKVRNDGLRAARGLRLEEQPLESRGLPGALSSKARRGWGGGTGQRS